MRVGFVACGMVWNASRVFHGRKPNLPGLVLGAIAWTGMSVALPSLDSAMRLTVGAAIVAIYAALTASELWTRAAAGHAEALADDCRCRSCMAAC